MAVARVAHGSARCCFEKSAARFWGLRGARSVVFDRVKPPRVVDRCEAPQRTCEPVPIHLCEPGARPNSNLAEMPPRTVLISDRCENEQDRSGLGVRAPLEPWKLVGVS